MNKEHVFASGDAVNDICAGIDIHRDKVNVSVAVTEGDKVRFHYDVFYTIASDLERMRNWLKDFGCKVVGMESTGQYWRPVFNALEDDFKIHLYNARHIKNIPGKKTDKKDSQWIARITRHELIGHSFIPDKLTRITRDIVRTRKSKVAQRTRSRQQIHDVLTCCGIRIAICMSDIFGVSGRILLDCIAKNKVIDKAFLEKKMHHPINKKIDMLYDALQGTMTDEHRYLLQQTMREEAYSSLVIADIEDKLKKIVLAYPEKAEVLKRIIEIPGFSERSALLLIGEMGIDLSSFPSAQHFASWCGLAPGSKQSAGKNMSGRIVVRQHYLRSLLVEVAFAATHCKNSYYHVRFAKLRTRKSPQKAIIAIARNLSQAIYMIIKEGKTYADLTPYYEPRNTEMRDLKSLQRLAKKLGKDTSLTCLQAYFEAQEHNDEIEDD